MLPRVGLDPPSGSAYVYIIAVARCSILRGEELMHVYSVDPHKGAAVGGTDATSAGSSQATNFDFSLRSDGSSQNEALFKGMAAFLEVSSSPPPLPSPSIYLFEIISPAFLAVQPISAPPSK